MDNEDQILLLEDDLLAQLTIRKMLEELGYSKIDSASTVDDARFLTSQKEYSVIFCDVFIKGSDDGISFIKEQRSKTQAKIVLQTGLSMEDLEKYEESKLADFTLLKPYDYDEVRELLENV